LHPDQPIRWFIQYHSCAISGSHGGEYEDESLLGYSALTIEALRTSETSVYSKTTLRYIQVDSYLNTIHIYNGMGQPAKGVIFELFTIRIHNTDERCMYVVKSVALQL
jgi:hypothetical protein